MAGQENSGQLVAVFQVLPWLEVQETTVGIYGSMWVSIRGPLLPTVLGWNEFMGRLQGEQGYFSSI